MTAEAKNPKPDSREIPIELLAPSKTNPRKSYDKKEMTELKVSVAKHGILQPILIRPAGTKNFEVVAGERRRRAAVLVGLKTVPAMVRTLTDEEAVEIQVVENLQRTDLHPLEEAAGYKKLMMLAQGRGAPITVDDLTIKVGKSRGYIYGRLKLLELPPPAKKAFFAGKLSASIALLIARIPDQKLATKATAEITPDRWDGPLSFRRAKEHIQENYMLRLADAPWSATDVALVPKAGACSECPKRTGNNLDLFGDVDGKDVCTDPPCFKFKQDAWWKIRRAGAVEAGEKIIEGAAFKKQFPHGYQEHWLGEKNLVRQSARCDHVARGKRSWARVLGKDAPTPILIRTDEGEIVECFPLKPAESVLKKRGIKIKPAHSYGPEPSPAEAKREAEARRKARIKTEATRRIVSAIVGRANRHFFLSDVRIIVGEFIREIWADTIKSVVARREIENKTNKTKALLDLAGKSSMPELHGLLAELVAFRSTGGWGADFSDGLKRIAKHYKVDVGKIRAGVSKEFAAANRKKNRQGENQEKQKGQKTRRVKAWELDLNRG